MYMLDTNAVIMGMKHPESNVFKRIYDHVGVDVCISVITLAELEYGIKKSKNPHATREGVYRFLAGIPVVDYDSEAAHHFGDIFGDLEIRKMRIGDRDTLIAAHARSLGYTLVTNNVREFSRVRGLKYVDWSE